MLDATLGPLGKAISPFLLIHPVECGLEYPFYRGRPGAFFDRDGVINVDHGYVHRIDDLEWVEGAAEAVRLCNRANYAVFIVTNQAGIAHGYYDSAAAEAFNRHLVAVLADQGARIDGVRYCPHHPDAKLVQWRVACDCRKPAPGMVNDLIRTWHISREGSFLVGDKQSDIEAAKAAGIRGILFQGGSLADCVHMLLLTPG